MDELPIYLIKVNLITIVLFAVYRFTFHYTLQHQFNRFLLVMIPAVSVFIPLINLKLGNTDYSFGNMLGSDFEALTGSVGSLSKEVSANNSSNAGILILVVYIAGCTFFLGRLIMQVIKIMMLVSTVGSIRKGKYNIVYSYHRKAFSLFNHIFLSSVGNAGIKDEIVLAHEKIHIDQKHSYDLLWIEIYRILFWYNPFILLLKENLKVLHEYIVDQKMAEEGPGLELYIQSLISGAEITLTSGLANPFGNKKMKGRICMLLKNRTSRLRKLYYLFLIPIIAGITVSFSQDPPGERPSICPVCDAIITLKFGFKGLHPITKKEFTHQGIDLKAPLGTDVVASGSGIVLEAAEKEAWGNLIIIQHDEEYTSYYAHLDSMIVEKGNRVKTGQPIGYVGNTGYSTGPHLHYEVRKNGRPVDPSGFFK